MRNGIRQIPFNFALLYNYGVVNEKLGKLNVAKKFFRFAKTVNPESADALYCEAIVCFKLGQYHEAFEKLEQGIALVPDPVVEEQKESEKSKN